MKKITLLTVAFLCVTTMAFAYCENCKKENPEEYCAKKMAEMTERLGLSEEQVAEIEPLVKEKIEKKQAVMDEARAQKEAIKQEYTAKIKAVLDEEQQGKLDEWMEESKANKGKGYMHGKMKDMEEATEEGTEGAEEGTEEAAEGMEE